MFGPMGPPQGPPMPPGPMGAPPMGAPPMGGAPMGAPGMAQGTPPAGLMSALLGPLAMGQEQERADLEAQQQLQVAQLVASMQQPSVGGAMAVSEPAPPGMGVDPMGMGEPEDPMAGGY
jgi:hypothetical protein